MWGDCQLRVALVRDTPRHSRPASIRCPGGRLALGDNTCRSSRCLRRGGRGHRVALGPRGRRRHLPRAVAVDRRRRRRRDRLRLQRTQALRRRRRRLVVTERPVATGVLRQTNARVAEVGRHHPHRRRRGTAAAKARLHVGADGLGARAARRPVAVRLTAPVRAALHARPDRAAPERASAATAVHRRRQRTVVDADRLQEPAAAATDRRAAEPRPEAAGNAAGAGGEAGHALVGGVLAALDRRAVRPRHVGSLGALLAGDDVELDLS